MAVNEIISARRTDAPLERPLELTCFALIVAYAVYLVASYVNGLWIIGLDGSRNATDFVDVWAAGKLVLQGQAASVYDWPTHKAMEESALGHAFEGYFGWHYPPTYLFVAAALALMPYGLAAVLWTFGSFSAYLVAIRAILGGRNGLMLAAAFPAVLSNLVIGQNGFLSAALIGGALVLLEKRPVMAGVLIGLLTYKPHLGLLVPIALVVGGHWRAFITAGFVAMLMAAGAWVAFGTDAWIGFIGNISHTSDAFLSKGWADFGKLQTAFGLIRCLGGPEPLAWAVQGTIALAAATAVALVWRSRANFALKAATLSVCGLLATPYLYTYDLVVLAVPLAFLLRLGRVGGFRPYEVGAIAIACALVLVFPILAVPVGFGAVLIVAALVARRIGRNRFAAEPA
jgi:hypothetical protein